MPRAATIKYFCMPILSVETSFCYFGGITHFAWKSSLGNRSVSICVSVSSSSSCNPLQASCMRDSSHAHRESKSFLVDLQRAHSRRENNGNRVPELHGFCAVQQHLSETTDQNFLLRRAINSLLAFPVSWKISEERKR